MPMPSAPPDIQHRLRSACASFDPIFLLASARSDRARHAARCVERERGCCAGWSLLAPSPPAWLPVGCASACGVRQRQGFVPELRALGSTPSLFDGAHLPAFPHRCRRESDSNGCSAMRLRSSASTSEPGPSGRVSRTAPLPCGSRAHELIGTQRYPSTRRRLGGRLTPVGGCIRHDLVRCAQRAPHRARHQSGGCDRPPSQAHISRWQPAAST
jgi:hypothetical protein